MCVSICTFSHANTAIPISQHGLLLDCIHKLNPLCNLRIMTKSYRLHSCFGIMRAGWEGA